MRVLARADGVEFDVWKDALNRASFFYQFSYATGVRIPTPATINMFNAAMERKLMSRFNGQGRKPQRNGGMPEFVNHTLNAGEKADFEEWKLKASKELDDMIEDALAALYKLSISWDDANQCFIAAATGRDERSDNYNMVLTGRADDFTTAYLVLFYKMVVVFEGGKWINQERNNSFG